MTLRTKLENDFVIMDGAMGTYLYDTYQVQSCFEEVNLTQPTIITEVHKSYVDAGADLIKTNTYAANAIKLAKHQLADKVIDINAKAVELAKAATEGTDAYVAGTIGGIRGVTRTETTLEEIEASFREQLQVFLDNGVDAILLETYYDEEELHTVLKIAREATDVPIIAQLALQEAGRTQNGTPLTAAFLTLESLGADIVGINCRLGPYHTIEALRYVPLMEDAYISAAPNAGLPDVQDGRLFFKAHADYFGECARSLRDQGARVIGGCCGTTPAHIAAMAAAVRPLTPLTEKQVPLAPHDVIEVVSQPLGIEPLHVQMKTRTSVIVELDPPKHLVVEDYFKGAALLQEAGVDAITIADNSLASPRVCNTAIATILKTKYNINPLVHLSCRDRNLIGLQSHLMGLHTAGIHEILAVTGDPTKIGDFPGASSVYDLQSFELIKLMKQFNNGYSHSGKPLKEKTQFSIAGAFNPNVKYLDKAVKRLEKKVANGADYFISQPVYSEEQLIDVAEAIKTLDAPLYIGIMPLTGHRNAEFLHHEVPGIKLTDSTRAIMAATKDDPAAARREGIAMAKQLIDVALDYFPGIYVITPFLKYEWSIELVHYIHEQTQKKQQPVTPFLQ
ncbi:bifunctional homocysteine S-methyltransferase/methylenetetrahydrofolate reductase [Aureibacillus halotolerans]|uniref:Homocysteine S-methyltransferase n=1 Tax=Aureibacillus halotolerans TaxID=1508390 RepID=A0A4R6U8M4_9BACI|nr:bifunctional homocysteine S-methyltransferase/methylenetetrahydrofolate reductase [Aureibacillus halotolerans]TDQ42092.1 homocysteine S-methyltransferase [Aureibacillus halotolerans]